MGNILNNNRHNIKLIPDYDEYWDFFLNKDSYDPYCFDASKLYDKCLITYIDTTNQFCVEEEDWLHSTTSYTWESGVSIGYDLLNVGYTAMDNGLIRFRKDKINNENFIKLFSESNFSFIKDDLRLKIHAISGNTMQYEYPLRLENGLARCNGGFYQGVFKTECDKYWILPTDLQQEMWDFEFVINKTEFEKESDKTLNDKHPENKGFFFYLGTRAENKWAFLYDEKLNSSDTMNTDDVVDYNGMTCNQNTRFTDVDWYTEMNEWRFRRDFPTTDNYIDYIYYPNELYTEDDYFGDFIFDETKPIVIDDKSLAKELEDCCSCKQTKKIITTQIKCCCNKCRGFSREIVLENNTNNCDPCNYLEDYIGNLDDMHDDYDYVEPELDITDFDFQTANYGFSLSKYKTYSKIYTDNKFLLFHRCGTGYTVGNWVEDTVVEFLQQNNTFSGNLFLMANRTCTGYTVSTIDDLKECYTKKYNIYNDLYNNALGFRITDDGEIGYRYLSIDCELSGDNKIKIYEGYSNKNVIKEEQWHEIHVKVYGGQNTMYFKFYVDGKLKYITSEMPILNLRKLNEEDEKQELVPFNLSLGGGTQGLCDVIMPNYMKVYDEVLPLEQYFGGTFIGYIKIFRWYNCSVELMNIRNNFKYDIRHLIKK